MLLGSYVSGGQELVISEFMAINSSTLQDEDGDFSDWLEIHNPGDEAVSLDGWYLTDNEGKLAKWEFPAIVLDQNQYLVVFASEKKRSDAASELHTNFKLSGSGEFLALVKPDGTTLASSFGSAYPLQQADVSYALIDGNYVFSEEPTPGVANVSDGSIPLPVFSQARGFYTSSFSLDLSHSGDVDLYYTLDGSSPHTTNGQLYSTPIELSGTSVVSVIAIEKNSDKASAVVTQTYLMPDVLDQSNAPEGYPTVWGQGFPGDYEMDPEICTDDQRPAVLEALESLPTVSLVLDVDDLFLDSEDITKAGIYLNSTQAADEWERPVSMEYFDPKEGLDFQLNCGLRVHGGNGRKPGNSPKHSFRVSFRSSYGPSKLNYNMFEESSATNEFNSLVLRAGYNYSWLKNSPAQCEGTDYIRDPFTKKTQLDMDRTAAHTKFVHLYLNGMYWGVYNISEKITDDFVEAYLGGKEEDYDVVKDHNGVTDGNFEAWQQLLNLTAEGFETNEKYFKVQGMNEDGTLNTDFQNLLDVRNLTDYMIINYYIGNGDWDRNNWLAARNRVTNEHGFKFFCWDAETSMNDLEANLLDQDNEGNPTRIFHELIKNDEYRLFFADRVQKHFYDDGELTPEETIKRYQKIADEIDLSMLAESARWGDYRRDVDGGSSYELYTRDDHWQKQVDHMINTYLPQRSGIVLAHFKDAGLLSAVEAPVFSTYSGLYETLIDLAISSDAGTIYFTTDDSDPRLAGGEVGSTATMYTSSLMIIEDTEIKARVLVGDQWSALVRVKIEVDLSNVPTVPVSICQGEEFKGYSESGEYYLLEQSSLGKDSLTILNLTVNELPDVNIGEDAMYSTGEAFTIQPDRDFQSYFWSTGETTKSIEVIENASGTYHYWLRATDDHGCANMDTTLVEIIAPLASSDERGLVYPNPSTDYLNLNLKASHDYTEIELRTMDGRSLYSCQLITGTTLEPIDVRHLATGSYILVVKSHENQLTFRIVKE